MDFIKFLHPFGLVKYVIDIISETGSNLDSFTLVKIKKKYVFMKSKM